MLMAIKYPTNLLHARTSTHKHILRVHTCGAVKAKRPEQERKEEEEEKEKEEEEANQRKFASFLYTVEQLLQLLPSSYSLKAIRMAQLETLSYCFSFHSATVLCYTALVLLLSLIHI